MTKKTLYVILILLLASILFTACSNDDDWAPYTHYTKELDIQLTSLPGSISNLEEEITGIAEKYDKNTKLNRAVVTFNNIDQINTRKGNIDFYFYKPSDDNVNQATSIILRFDMETNKVYEVEFEKGHGKRVWGSETTIKENNAQKPLKDIFKMLEDNDQYRSKILEVNPSLKFEFEDNRLYIFLYDQDENQGPVLRYKEEVEI